MQEVEHLLDQRRDVVQHQPPAVAQESLLPVDEQADAGRVDERAALAVDQDAAGVDGLAEQVDEGFLTGLQVRLVAGAGAADDDHIPGVGSDGKLHERTSGKLRTVLA